MYRKAEKQDVEKLLTYFEQDLKNCLYSYIDLKKFGIENPNLTVYFDEADGIRCSALKYYEGLQLFDAEGKIDAEATAGLIKELNSHIVSSTIDVIEKLCPLLKDTYEMEQGYVTEMLSMPACEISEEVRPAEISEYDEISRLICSDDACYESDDDDYHEPPYEEEFFEEKVPLDDFDEPDTEIFEIEEGDVILADIPKTGSSSLILLGVSMLSGAGLFLAKKIKKDEE